MLDWFKRNRTYIGAIAFAGWALVAETEPTIANSSRLNRYVPFALGVIFGGGAFKSDQYHKDRQPQ